MSARITLTEEQIGDLIDDWHRADEDGVQLVDYLGWTWPQYTAYLKDGKAPEQDDTSLLRDRLRGR